MKRWPWFTNEHGDVADTGLSIIWQKGPLAEGVNGCTPDLVLRALVRKFELWQTSVPCSENQDILRLLELCLGLLDVRIRDRAVRGVMGTQET